MAIKHNIFCTNLQIHRWGSFHYCSYIHASLLTLRLFILLLKYYFFKSFCGIRFERVGPYIHLMYFPLPACAALLFDSSISENIPKYLTMIINKTTWKVGTKLNDKRITRPLRNLITEGFTSQWLRRCHFKYSIRWRKI